MESIDGQALGELVGIAFVIIAGLIVLRSYVLKRRNSDEEIERSKGVKITIDGFKTTMRIINPLLILSITCLILTACNSDPETEIAETEPPQLIDSAQAGQTLKYIDIIDTSRMTIIPLSNVGWMNENYTQAKLSIIELAELDTLLFVSSEEYNQKIISDYEELMAFYREEAEFMDETFVEWDFASDHTILDLSNYRRQYIPYYN